MYLRQLQLRSFRSFKERVFEFGPHVNIITGPNAKGKSTLLEAIHFLMTGKSFRARQVSDMIRMGDPFFSIEAVFKKNGVEQRIKAISDGNERKIYYNNNLCPSVSSLLGTIQGVLIVPDDVNLIKGTPTARRSFLDMQLAQKDPLYVHHLSRYYGAMKERNCLLKLKQFNTIEVWEQVMSKAAAYIVEKRFSAVQELSLKARQVHFSVSQSNEDLLLTYKSEVSLNEDMSAHYLRGYQKNRKRESECGFSLNGPHRDDLSILINNEDTRFFASEGQQRSAVASLRLAEWHRLREGTGEDVPLMLMDDITLSLDPRRRGQLLSLLPEFRQVFLTGTEPLDVPGGVDVQEIEF